MNGSATFRICSAMTAAIACSALAAPVFVQAQDEDHAGQAAQHAESAAKHAEQAAEHAYKAMEHAGQIDTQQTGEQENSNSGSGDHEQHMHGNADARNNEKTDAQQASAQNDAQGNNRNGDNQDNGEGNGQGNDQGNDQGESVYRQTCATCHDAGVAGAPQIGNTDAWEDRIAKGKETLYQHAINGFSGEAGVMPPKGGNPQLTADEVRAAVDYMVEQSD